MLHDDADRPLTTKVSSFAQDLLYTVNSGRHLTPKHILLHIYIYIKEETKKNYKFAVTLCFMLYIVNSYSETWTRPKPPVTTKIQDQRYAYKRENSLKKSLIWIFCRFLKCSNKSVNSWTGFNIITKNINDLVVTKDAVGYVSTIGTPAISMNNWHTCNKYQQLAHLQ